MSLLSADGPHLHACTWNNLVHISKRVPASPRPPRERFPSPLCVPLSECLPLQAAFKATQSPGSLFSSPAGASPWAGERDLWGPKVWRSPDVARLVCGGQTFWQIPLVLQAEVLPCPLFGVLRVILRVTKGQGENVGSGKSWRQLRSLPTSPCSRFSSSKAWRPLRGGLGAQGEAVTLPGGS